MRPRTTGTPEPDDGPVYEITAPGGPHHGPRDGPADGPADEPADGPADGPAASRWGGPRPRTVWRRVVVGGVAVAMAGLAVVALRLGDGTLPLPPPGPDVLDLGGLGGVRLGQDVGDARSAACGDRCGDGEWLSGRGDEANRCFQFEWRPRGPGATAGPGWAWVQDGRVVAVGVETVASPGRHVLVWPGLELGGRLDPGLRALRDWTRDRSVPVPVLRSTTRDGSTVTLADVGGHGRLDYAVVATPAGERCAVDAQSAEFGVDARPPGPDELIRGDTLAGVSLGTPMLDAITLSGAGARQVYGEYGSGCGVLWRGPRSAVIGTDEVEGLLAAGIAGGPVAGMTVGEAAALLVGPQSTGQPDQIGQVPARAVTGRDALGRVVVVVGYRPPTYLPGLDRPITDPDLVSPRTVVGVVVGNPCRVLY